VDKDDVDAPRLEGHYVSVFFFAELRDWTQHRPKLFVVAAAAGTDRQDTAAPRLIHLLAFNHAQCPP
jgi:hypothetical protein